ncbi:MAG: hypothetical protein ABIG64_06750 [Candidatus Omnitrophota bacterium]
MKKRKNNIFFTVISLGIIQILVFGKAGLCESAQLGYDCFHKQSSNLSPRLLINMQMLKVFHKDNSLANNYFIPPEIKKFKAEISQIKDSVDLDKISRILLTIQDWVKLYNFRYANCNFKKDLSEFKLIDDSSLDAPVIKVENNLIIVNIAYFKKQENDDLLLLALGYGMLLQTIKAQFPENKEFDRAEKLYVLNKLVSRFNAYGEVDKKRQEKIYDILKLENDQATPVSLIKKIIGKEVYDDLNFPEEDFKVEIIKDKIKAAIDLKNLRESPEIKFFKTATSEEIIDFLLTGKISLNDQEYIFNIQRFSDVEIIIRDIFVFLLLYEDKPQQLTYFTPKIMNALVSFLAITAMTDREYHRYVMSRINYFKKEIGFTSVKYLQGPIITSNARLRLEVLSDTLLKISQAENIVAKYQQINQVHKVWKQLEVRDVSDVDELIEQLDSPFYSIIPILLFEALQKKGQDISVQKRIINQAFPRLFFDMIKKRGKDRYTMGGYLTLLISEVLGQIDDSEVLNILSINAHGGINEIINLWQAELSQLTSTIDLLEGPPEAELLIKLKKETVNLEESIAKLKKERANLERSIVILEGQACVIDSGNIYLTRNLFEKYLKKYIAKNVFDGEFIAFILAIGNQGIINPEKIKQLEKLKASRGGDRPVVEKTVIQAINILLQKICLEHEDPWGKGNLHLLLASQSLREITQEQICSFFGRDIGIKDIDERIIPELKKKIATEELTRIIFGAGISIHKKTRFELLELLAEIFPHDKWVKIISLKPSISLEEVDKAVKFLMQDLSFEKKFLVKNYQPIFKILVKIVNIYGFDKIKPYLEDFNLKEDFFKYLNEHSAADDVCFVIKKIAEYSEDKSFLDFIPEILKPDFNVINDPKFLGQSI